MTADLRRWLVEHDIKNLLQDHTRLITHFQTLSDDELIAASDLLRKYARHSSSVDDLQFAIWHVYTRRPSQHILTPPSCWVDYG